MSGDDDDYLSDKFLAEATNPAKPLTYSQRRKEAEKLAKLKNEQNRTKSRRQREVESREAGLSKSLFEKAKEDEAAGLAGNKALSIMMKMGFKPGQSLGKVEAQDESSHVSRSSEKQDSGPSGPSTSQVFGDEVSSKPSKPLPHRAEPLPLNEWAGAYMPTERLAFYHLSTPCYQERKELVWESGLVPQVLQVDLPRWRRWPRKLITTTFEIELDENTKIVVQKGNLVCWCGMCLPTSLETISFVW